MVRKKRRYRDGVRAGKNWDLIFMTFVYKSIGWTGVEKGERLRQSNFVLNYHLSIYNSAHQFCIINHSIVSGEIMVNVNNFHIIDILYEPLLF